MGMKPKFKLQWATLAVCAGLSALQFAGAAFDSAVLPTTTELQVARTIPEGKKVPVTDRQIVVTFDRPVTPLGSMALSGAESPVGILPAVNCQWHRLDPRSLACELIEAEPLAPATQYSVTVKEGGTRGGRHATEKRLPLDL
jgi:hypothetical protein